MLCFVCKTALHYYLDNKHNRNAGFIYAVMNPVQYLRPYKAAVSQQFLRMKQVCNILPGLGFIALLLNILPGLIIYLN